MAESAAAINFGLQGLRRPAVAKSAILQILEPVDPDKCVLACQPYKPGLELIAVRKKQTDSNRSGLWPITYQALTIPFRVVFILIPLLAGCAHDLRVVGPYPETPMIKRCLVYWTSNFSTNAINHFYVGAVKPTGGSDALIYWKEERTIIEYDGLAPDAPRGAEIEAFRGTIKLDQDTVDTPDDIAGSTYLETHRTWVGWMEGCLSRGREYVIRLDEARRLSPKVEDQ